MSDRPKPGGQRKATRSHKVVFLGQSGTGKTSLIRQFVYRTFDQCYQATVGMDFVTKLVTLEDGDQMRLQLWDTAGQERFRALVPSYLRDSSVCVIVYDVTSRESFNSVKGWVEQVLEARSRQEVTLALVGNKIDLEDRKVQYSEGEALATELKMLFFEATALKSDLVDAVFHGLAAGLSCEPKAESDDEIVLEPQRRPEVSQKRKKCCV
ncbi:unnamed protein product [Durusdinium trenchii]|uniref:Uncharacterized protein n=2 Tax=Durusdinium trenchii TaxID=1381693 RepID=A0ABP0JBK0_9DINO